jgi:aminomethyltransferase
MCDEAGGIIDDLIVYRTGEFEFLVVGNAANRSTDAEWIAGHLPAGVEFADESDRTALVAVQGPAAIAVISELAEEGFEIPGRFTIAEALLDTIPALVSRTGYTGEDGVEIYCHAGSAAALWRALLSFPEVTPCGLGARDTLRLEMGYALYGTDMDRSVDPISAGLGWTVPKAKTGFIGAEAIARIRESGPASRLVGILLEEGVPRHGHPVLHESTEVGKVASGTYSPTLGRGIATAYVPSALAEPGTQLEVAVRRKVHRASVVRPPLESKS